MSLLFTIAAPSAFHSLSHLILSEAYEVQSPSQLQVRKSRHKEVKKFTQSHGANKKQSEVLKTKQTTKSQANKKNLNVSKMQVLAHSVRAHERECALFLARAHPVLEIWL